MDKTEDPQSTPSRSKEERHFRIGSLSKTPSSQNKSKRINKKSNCESACFESAYTEDGSQSFLDPTTMYLNEIGHTPLLSANEEIRLAREIAQGNDNSRK